MLKNKPSIHGFVPALLSLYFLEAVMTVPRDLWLFSGCPQSILVILFKGLEFRVFKAAFKHLYCCHISVLLLVSFMAGHLFAAIGV